MKYFGINKAAVPFVPKPKSNPMCVCGHVKSDHMKFKDGSLTCVGFVSAVNKFNKLTERFACKCHDFEELTPEPL